MRARLLGSTAVLAVACGGRARRRRPAVADDLATLAARVQVLEDREEIRALILAYGQAHDHRDYRTFASLFAANGEWIGGLGTAKGPDAIFALMDKSIGHNPLPNGSGTFHVMTNDQIKIDGDRASSVTKWLYITAADDNSPKLDLPRPLRRRVRPRERALAVLCKRQSVSDISPLRR